MVGVSSNIVNATANDVDIQESSQQELLKILQALENQLIKSVGLGHNTTSENDGNIVFTTLAVEAQEASKLGFSFTVQQNSGDDILRPGDIMSGYQSSSQDVDLSRSSVTLPPSLFESFGNGKYTYCIQLNITGHLTCHCGQMIRFLLFYLFFDFF